MNCSSNIPKTDTYPFDRILLGYFGSDKPCNLSRMVEQRKGSRPHAFEDSPTHRGALNRPRYFHASQNVNRFQTKQNLARAVGPNARALQKRLGFIRPNAQVITAIATAVVLFAIVLLVRAAAIIPAHGEHHEIIRGHRLHGVKMSIKPNPKSSRIGYQHATTHNPQTAVRTKAAAKQANLSSIVAADGSRFFVDLSGNTFDIRYAGTQSHLAIHAMTRWVSSKPAALAFFIQVSDATIGLLSRLLVVLWHPQHVYVIHLDAKIKPEKAENVKRVIGSVNVFQNVYFLPSEVITYKGVSMLLNTLSGMDFLLTKVRHKWEFFINLSGSDYPLVNSHTMAHVLGDPEITSRNMSFIQLAESKEFWESMKKSRFDYIYYDTAIGMANESTTLSNGSDTKLINTWVRHPILDQVGVEFTQSEAWIIAHRTFAELATQSTQGRKMLLLLSLMQDPEEHFFAMLAWNSPSVNKSLAHHAFRAVFWELNGKMSGQHPYYIDQTDEHGDYPFWLGHLVESRCFFARKVKSAHSPLLDRIDQYLSGTHPNAHQSSIAANLSAMHHFVQCISHVDDITHQIRGYNICG